MWSTGYSNSSLAAAMLASPSFWLRALHLHGQAIKSACLELLVKSCASMTRCAASPNSSQRSEPSAQRPTETQRSPLLKLHVSTLELNPAGRPHTKPSATDWLKGSRR